MFGNGRHNCTIHFLWYMLSGFVDITLVFCVVFCRLWFVLFAFGHCIVCSSSNYSFLLAPNIWHSGAPLIQLEYTNNSITRWFFLLKKNLIKNWIFFFFFLNTKKPNRLKQQYMSQLITIKVLSEAKTANSISILKNTILQIKVCRWWKIIDYIKHNNKILPQNSLENKTKINSHSLTKIFAKLVLEFKSWCKNGHA
jgi:hypothetical protein